MQIGGQKHKIAIKLCVNKLFIYCVFFYYRGLFCVIRSNFLTFACNNNFFQKLVSYYEFIVIFRKPMPSLSVQQTENTDAQKKDLVDFLQYIALK